MFDYLPQIQTISLGKEHQVDVLRLDLLDKDISGNKWFKLKYNLQKVRDRKYKGILTFGGAHSNHLAATAVACQRAGLPCAAVIRGEDAKIESPTIRFIKDKGMQVHFVSRSQYASKNSEKSLNDWMEKFPEYWIVPEGGANAEGMKGAEEIWKGLPHYDYVFCACGTATTFAGLLKAVPEETILVGLSVLKGENLLQTELADLFKNESNKIPVGNEILEQSFIQQHCLTNIFAYKGYASFEKPVFEFAQTLFKETGLQLDHVYTSKLFFGAKELLETGRIPANKKVLLIHTGGLQGNVAFESRYGLSSQC